jgi:hypothetical protein
MIKNVYSSLYYVHYKHGTKYFHYSKICKRILKTALVYFTEEEKKKVVRTPPSVCLCVLVILLKKLNILSCSMTTCVKFVPCQGNAIPYP